MSLDDNMRMAVAVAGEVRLKVPKSANYKFTSSAITINGQPLPLHTTTNQSIIDVRQQNSNPWGMGIEGLRKDANTIMAAGVGNCGELALVATVLLYDKGGRAVDYVYIGDGTTNNAVVPHAFTVVGRKLPMIMGGHRSNAMGLPDQWGADAVVCDPWDRVVYPAKDYDFFWAGLRKHSTDPTSLTCVSITRLT